MDTLKTTIVTFFGALAAYLTPVYNAMFVLCLVFCADILFGILADRIVHQRRISLKKLLLSVLFFALYASIVASTFTIGDYMDDRAEALYIVKVLTYVFIYFYVANTLKNLRQLAPRNRAVAFLDHWLGLEFLKRIPALDAFLKHEKEPSKPDK